MSNTPRTDETVKFIQDQLKESPDILTDHPYYVLDVMAKLAREFERELNKESNVVFDPWGSDGEHP